MFTPTEFPTCLAEARAQACRQCAKLWRRRMQGSVRGARRWICARCTLAPLLQAVAGTIPAADLDGWLKQPNDDLEGRTPRECMEVGDFDAVFHALWLREELGPVS